MGGTTWRYRLGRLLPDGTYRSLKYRQAHGRFPDRRHPRSFTEKVDWRIVHDRRDQLARTCDKLAGKEIAARHGGLRVTPTLWSGSDLAELASLDLPAHWILKPNNRSGRYRFGEGRVPAGDVDALRRETADWLTPLEYLRLREWGYSRARPVFLVEERIGGGRELFEVKCFAFDGVVRYLLIVLDRFTYKRRVFMSPDWRDLEVVSHRPKAEDVPRPAGLERLLEVAGDLAEGFDHLRVDVFLDGGEIWFNEFTPYSWSGLERILPVSIDRAWGDLWTLPDLDSDGR